MRKRLTTEEFIKKARIVHGDKYNYSMVQYEHNKEKVIIICTTHGEFTQTPNRHLSGDGCPKCGGTNKSTTEEFIKKAEKIHYNTYDYSNVRYINNKTKVNIICTIHGSFFQKPNTHLNGHGCPYCSGVKKLTNEEFIKRANVIHDNFYDYSMIDYINTENKIIIICPQHGKFEQTPHSHLNGNGCEKCGNIKKGLAKRHTKENFIEKARKIHGDKYDYSKVEYIKNNIKVTIICPIHGEFNQKPNAHLNNGKNKGNGCPFCGYKSNDRFLNYQDAKKYVQSIGIKTSMEYQEWWKKNKPDFLPYNIERYYKQI